MLTSNKLDVPTLWSQETAQVIAKERELSCGVNWLNADLATIRAAYREEHRFWNEGGPEMAEVINETVMTRHGLVGVRLNRPVRADGQEGPLAVIVYLHGGSWVVGDCDTHARIARTLADRAGALVVQVDYSLAPEAPYPQAVEECVDVVSAVADLAERWGADASDISLGGDSAGANLSVAVFKHLRDIECAADPITSLLLFYGTYGLRDSVSMRLYGGSWDGLDEESWRWYLEQYPGPDHVREPYFDVLGTSLHGAPPSYIVSAALDPLRDDSRALEAVLLGHGVICEHVEVPGVLHGFLHHSRILSAARDVLEGAAAFHRSGRGQRGGVLPSDIRTGKGDQ